MSKMKNYDLVMYESINDGVHHFINEGRLYDYGFQVYSEKALNGALAFLCLNDIQHSYTVTPLCADFAKFGVHSVVCLTWEGDERRENFTFWSTMEADYECDNLHL